MQERSTSVSAREVARLMQSLLRVVRGRQLYRANNAAYQRMMQDLLAGFAELLNRETELSLKVRAEHFYFEDEVVLEDANPETSLSLALFRDGVRRLDFSRGLNATEIEAFVDACALGSGRSALGEDIVSYLWRHQLEHLHYLVVETTIVDAAPGSAAGAGAVDMDLAVEGLLRQIYGESSDDVGPRSVRLDAADLSAKQIAEQLDAIDDLAPGFHPPRAFLDSPAYTSRLLAEAGAEDEVRLAFRAADAALRALATDFGSFEKASFLEAMLRKLDAALVAGRLPLAAWIVNGVKGSGHLGRNGEAWVKEAAAEARIRQATQWVTEGPDGEVAFASFHSLLAAYGRPAVPVILRLLPNIQVASMRRSLAQLVLRLGVDDLSALRELLFDPQAYVAQEALFILNGLGTPEAQRLLQQADQHDRVEVRLARLESSKDNVDAVARRLSDPDARVRVTAAKMLLERPTKEGVQAMELYVESPGFEHESLEVKREQLRVYAALCQVRSLHLLSRYIKKGEGLLASKDAEELAAAAIDATVLVPTPRTVELLKKACLARSRRVRESARAALVALREGR